MEHLIRNWQNQFYLSTLQDVVLIIALFVSIKNRKKFTILRYLPFYTFCLLAASLSMASYYFAKDENFYLNFFFGFPEYVDYFFTLIELTIFSHFYFQLIENIIVRKVIITLNLFFIIFFIYMAVTDKNFYQFISETTQSKVYTVESIILLFVSSFYFIELFKKLPFITLKNQPVFWVSTGVFFFMVCTLPYSLLENYIRKNYPSALMTSYTIFHVFYTLLFLMIIRAYLCKPEKTT